MSSASASSEPMDTTTTAPVASAPVAATAAAPAASSFQPSFSIGELHRGGSQLLPLCTDLASIHACAYCMLRYVNIKQEKAYSQTPEWLQAYTREKLGWSLVWSTSACPLCLGVLARADTYWTAAIEPALRDTQTGEWKYVIEKFTLNASEPILAKVRQHAANLLFKSKYSRLQGGHIDLKEAIKWRYSAMIIARAGGGTGQMVQGACDFGFLLTFQTDIPDQEYNMIVATLPRNEQAAARRAQGDFSIPATNNPAVRAEGSRGKKNPRSDVMGQKSVAEAMQKIKKDDWLKLDIFQPIQAAAAAAKAATAAATAATPAPAPATAAAMPDAMDTSSSSTVVSSKIHVPAGYPLPLTTLVPFPTLLLSAHREPILVSGNYRKLYRFLSQSVWHLGNTKMLGAGQERDKKDAKIMAQQGAAAASSSSSSSSGTVENSGEDVVVFRNNEDDDDAGGVVGADEENDEDADEEEEGRRMTDSSVEEEIVRMLLSHFEAREYKFHSSGREDMDVRMLGNGRQFFVEFIEAKKVPKGDFYQRIQPIVNANSEYVEVLDLHLSDKREFNAMKKSVATKRKTYRCVVWIEARLTGPTDERLQKLDAIKDLIIQQRTPIRVLHRRSLLTRPKTIHSARTHYVNSHFFYLDLVTSSGTYVKEFVHGDRARTLPNVGTLTDSHTEILQLDVIGFDEPQ